MYRFLYWLLLRHLPAEWTHHVSFALLRGLMAIPGVRALVASVCAPRDPALRVRALGLELPGPLGLAAGFDKEARGAGALLALGFGFVEVGTVTAQPQPGNPRPRMFRLTRDRALVNRLGFNNQGADEAQRRLRDRERITVSASIDGLAADGHPVSPRADRRRRRRLSGGRPGVVGVNIGKTKVVAEDDAIADYVASAERLAPLADYLVVNVSSPNTPGLRNLQAVEKLQPLLAAVRAACDRASPSRRVPLLVKIAPDLADDDIDAVADLALALPLDGVIATNTTIGRGGLVTPEAEVTALGAGGLSGRPLKARSLAVLRRLRARIGDRLVLVAVGGIEDADDAWQRITAGATLVQAYTGFVYGGPAWPRRVHRDLARKVRAAGMSSITDAIGRDARPQ